MTYNEYLSIAVIAVFSIVQSIFGMGILVFGTPTLLLLGYDFPVALSYLLPASWAVSLLQVLVFEPKRPRIPFDLYFFCLPAVGVGLFLSNLGPFLSGLNQMIGGMLILSAAIHHWITAQHFFSSLLKHNTMLYHVIMGLVHGLTNQGGALLAIFASRVNTGKNNIRYTVAYYYFAFNSIQILVLAIPMGYFNLLIAHAYTALVSVFIYMSIGNRIFGAVSNQFFSHILAFFMLIYGIIILV